MRKHRQTEWVNFELWEPIGLATRSKKHAAVLNLPDYNRSHRQSGSHDFKWQQKGIQNEQEKGGGVDGIAIRMCVVFLSVIRNDW